MKTPTLETIRKAIENCSPELAADLIYDAIHLPRKPLSELHLDQEACRKVFDKVTRGRFLKATLWNGHTRIKGFRVREDSQEWQTEVTIINGSAYLDGHNITDFYLVDFIRSLGYEPITSPHIPNPDQPV